MARLIWFPLTLACATLAAVWLQTAPLADQGGAITGLSRANLAQTVADMTVKPHVAGSTEQLGVRDYLVRRLEGLGLTVEIQRANGVRQTPRFDRPIAFSPVENLIAVLPGRDPSKPAVALMAHYDSVSFAPGAGDDAAGTAALLETARLIAAGPTPERDVVFLITDGEEQGLIGAQTFFDDHPLAKHIGAVVNVEARGSAGPATMFQTSSGNSALIDLWAKHAVAPSGNSLSSAVYRLLPNDSDLSVSLAAGKLGINAAFVGHQFDYHDPTDNAANLDPRTLVHLGQFALTTTRALAMAQTLPEAKEDSIYFDVFHLFVVRYWQGLGWGLLGLALAGLVLIDPKRLGTTRRAALTQAAVILAATLIAGLACYAVAKLLYPGGLISMRAQLAQMDLALWVYLALCFGMILGIRPRPATWLGAMLVAFGLALASQIALPGASWLFVWPLLVSLGLGLMAERFGAARTRLQAASLILGGIGLCFALSLIIYAYVSIGSMMPGVVALAIPFILMLLGPLITPWGDGKPARWGAVTLWMVAGLGALGLATSSPFNARHPRPGDLFYLTDLDHQTAYWASTSGDSELPGQKGAKRTFEGLKGLVLWQTPAPVTAFEAPRIGFAVQGETGQLTVSTRQRPRQFVMALRPSGTLERVRLNGKPVRLPQGEWTRFRTRADAPIDLTLDFVSAQPGTITLQYLTATDDMPDFGPRPNGPPTNWTILSGTHAVLGSQTLTWP